MLRSVASVMEQTNRSASPCAVPTGKLSIEFLDRYSKFNGSLDIKDIRPCWDVGPRRSEEHFGRSYKTHSFWRMNLLASDLLQGRTKIFEWLLQHRDDIGTVDLIDAIDPQPSTRRNPPYRPPLFVALACRRENSAIALLKHGASPAAGVSGTSVLHVAAAGGLPRSITRLVQHCGSDINQPDDRGNTPLIYALSSPYGNRDVLRALIGLGVDINKLTTCGDELLGPLSIACINSRWDMVMVLLENGADAKGGRMMLGHQCRQPALPLYWACIARENYPEGKKTRRQAVIKELLKEGADPNMSITYNHRDQPLVVRLISMKRVWEATCLIEDEHYVIDQRDPHDMTALQWTLSTEHGRPVLAWPLLQRGAKVPAVTSHELATRREAVSSSGSIGPR
ncbi:hypothetical protein JX266_014018 [Neoarthrinium moseri]|nr:hypothetical protein JX266_014018 [Neoarthrinium moseri]